MTLIENITTNELLNSSFDWLCSQRKNRSDGHDIWVLRWYWSIKQTERMDLKQKLLNGDYLFNPVKRYHIDNEIITCWSSRDALVLKATTTVLTEHLKPILSKRCFHVKGNGGLKKAILDIKDSLKENRFFIRTDVKGYYANINHWILYEQLYEYVKDKIVMSLFLQYLKYLVNDRGYYKENNKGISLGCALSPLMGALYLKPFDDAMAKLPVHYTRFMDDICITATTRWKLKKAISVMNKIFNDLKLEKHPDKTEIGCITKKSFTFLGYVISDKDITVAPKTFNRCIANINWLYEQNASEKRISEYWQHWVRWVYGRLSGMAHGLSASLILFLRQLCSYMMQLMKRLNKLKSGGYSVTDVPAPIVR